MQKKLLKILLILILGLIFYISVRTIFYPTLKIQATPTGSNIYLNQKLVGDTVYEANLKKGKYQIEVTKEGFVSQTREINLQNDTQINISLISPASQINTPPPEYKYNDIQVKDLPDSKIVSLRISPNIDEFVGIDFRSGKLISIKNDVSTDIYSGRVSSFSYQHPYIALTDPDSHDKIVLLNLENNTKRELSNSSLNFFISASIDLQKLTLYFLANYTPRTVQSELFKTPLTGFQPQKLTTTKATDITSLSNNKIALFTSRDENNASTLEIFDQVQKSTSFIAKGNSYIVAASGNYIAINSSTTITIADTQTLQQSSLSISANTPHAWKGDLLILINNTSNGPQVSLFDPAKKSIVQSYVLDQLKDYRIRSISNIKDNEIIVLTENFKYLKITIQDTSF
jgi:hypothetical protein